MAIYHIRPDRRPPGWHILTLADIPFYVEPSFLLIIGLFVFTEIEYTHAIPRAGLLGFIIFFSLLAHEAGHALVARLFGYRDISVSLVAFGGFTRHPATTRGHSLTITLAGPAVTLALAALAWILGGMPLAWLPFVSPEAADTLLGSPAPGMGYEVSQFIAATVFKLNLAWAVFNLMPILPMDGGKAILAILAFLVQYTRAMLYTAIVSLLTCAGLAALLFSGYFGPARGSLLIFYFLFTFVTQNAQTVRDLWPRR